MSLKLSSTKSESEVSYTSKMSRNYFNTPRNYRKSRHRSHEYEERTHGRIDRRSSSSENTSLCKSSLNESYRCGTTMGKSFESRCLGVFGMNILTKKKYIYDLFSKFGSIENFSYITDARTGLFRGFCFIYYFNTENAKIAKKTLNGVNLDGRKIRVDFSSTQRPHSPTPGLYMGRSTKELNNVLSLVILNQLLVSILQNIVPSVIAAVATVVILHRYVNYLTNINIVTVLDCIGAQLVGHNYNENNWFQNCKRASTTIL